jgi:hypothetical protein
VGLMRGTKTGNGLQMSFSKNKNSDGIHMEIPVVAEGKEKVVTHVRVFLDKVADEFAHANDEIVRRQIEMLPEAMTEAILDAGHDTMTRGLPGSWQSAVNCCAF